MKKTLWHIGAFTLIELMIVMTIIGIISLATYMPYAHHQKKVLVKQWAKQLSQSIAESRNLAIHWLDTGSWNVYVWIYFASGATQLDYYASTNNLDILSLPSNPYKVKKLPVWVQVDSIAGSSDAVLMSFAPITGSWYISLWSAWDEIDIQISYKWANSPVLQKNIRYYRKSNISDY